MVNKDMSVVEVLLVLNFKQLKRILTSSDQQIHVQLKEVRCTPKEWGDWIAVRVAL